MKRSGYTIVELLIVIAIIGLLTTLGTYVWSSSGKRSRDSVRKSDLSRMENALQQYYLENRSYPEHYDASTNILSAGFQLSNPENSQCSRGGKEVLTPKYLPTIPQDPRKSVNAKNASCEEFENQSSHYLYLVAKKTSGSPRNYALMATLENENDSDKLPIDENENPILDFGYDGLFKDYFYSGNSPTFFDPNYMITGSSGR